MYTFFNIFNSMSGYKDIRLHQICYRNRYTLFSDHMPCPIFHQYICFILGLQKQRRNNCTMKLHLQSDMIHPYSVRQVGFQQEHVKTNIPKTAKDFFFFYLSMCEK